MLGVEFSQSNPNVNINLHHLYDKQSVVYDLVQRLLVI